MKKIFVALSGGVDSSVSAAILKHEGYDVTGVYMKNWSGDDYGLQGDCPWVEDQKVAEEVCNKLKIPFMSFNFEKEYREKVVEYFFDEYKKGRTPNPDVMCNKEIKFGLFLDKATSMGAELIATGHYARNVLNSHGHLLLKGIDNSKDQSYFLNRINQKQLSQTWFPIGGFEKKDVREMAKKFKLPNHSRPDSQGICFIGEINVREFLKQRFGEKPGDIVDKDSGKVVGKHNGAYFFTIGQREGLGIGGTPLPYFIVETDIKENIVYVALGKDNPHIYAKTVLLEDLHLINHNYKFSENLSASVRYRQKPQECKLISSNDTHIIEFKEPQRAVTAGQSLVLYDGEICLGGGIIRTSE